MFKKFFNFPVLVAIVFSLIVSTDSVNAKGLSEVQNTPFFTILFGEIFLENGELAPVGTEIQFRTTSGDVAGEWTVSNPGVFGALFVYGVDTSITPYIPGFRLNEPILIFVNGIEYISTPQIRWENDWDFHHLVISPIKETVNVRVSGGPESLIFETDKKVLIHGFGCNGAIAREILPGITTIKVGNEISCPSSNWIYFDILTLEEGQKTVEFQENVIGWGISDQPYGWIWVRKPYHQNFLPIVTR